MLVFSLGEKPCSGMAKIMGRLAMNTNGEITFCRARLEAMSSPYAGILRAGMTLICQPSPAKKLPDE